MEIKEENSDSSNTRLKYPRNIGEFLDRNTPQLFLMQVNDESIKLIVQFQSKYQKKIHLSNKMFEITFQF